jgi:hypothetical protein
MTTKADMTRTLSSEAAAIVRPWGLLTAIALTYAAYTLHTGWPERVARSTPRIAMTSVQLRLPMLEIPRTIVKCVQDGTVMYTDHPCDTLFDVILLAPD